MFVQHFAPYQLDIQIYFEFPNSVSFDFDFCFGLRTVGKCSLQRNLKKNKLDHHKYDLKSKVQ